MFYFYDDESKETKGLVKKTIERIVESKEQGVMAVDDFYHRSCELFSFLAAKF